MSPLDFSLSGRLWTQAADGRIRCAACDTPSELVVWRTRTAETDQGQVVSVLWRSGPLCLDCDAQNGANP